MGHTIQRGINGCIAPFKEIQNLQFGKFLLWNPEYWALESWTQVKESRIPFKNWNLGSKFHWQRIQNRVPGIQNPRGGIKKPRMIGGLDLDQFLGPTPSALPRNFFFLRCPSVNSRHTKRAAPIPSLQCLVVYPAMTQEGIGWWNGNKS